MMESYCSFRSAAITQVEILPTVLSTDALSFGWRTLADMSGNPAFHLHVRKSFYISIHAIRQYSYKHIGCNEFTSVTITNIRCLSCPVHLNNVSWFPVDMYGSTFLFCIHLVMIAELRRRSFFCPNKKPNDKIEVDLNLDELDAISAEAKATYAEIKDYVLKEHGLKVSNLYILQRNIVVSKCLQKHKT